MEREVCQAACANRKRRVGAKSPRASFLRIVDDELWLLAFKSLLFGLGRLGSDLQGLFRGVAAAIRPLKL
jgi:hypothetical protein